MRPVEVVQTGSSAKKADAPSAITAATTTSGNVTPQQQNQPHNTAPPHNDAPPVHHHKDAPLPIVPNEANAAWSAKNKTDYETNKQEHIKAFHSFPEQFLQLSSDKTKHIELGTVFHRPVDDEIIVVTGRTQMNDCKF
jgi:hypothetical protein